MYFESEEADLLRSLFDDMRALLRAEALEGDPVIDRLFPDAYESDDDAAAFRDMVGEELRTTKLEAFEQARTSLGKEGPATVVLDGASADTWLQALTDVRLAVGTRLGVTEETMSRAVDPDRPTESPLVVLHWLGWIQESLLKAIA
jgi:hypothetical protein